MKTRNTFPSKKVKETDGRRVGQRRGGGGVGERQTEDKSEVNLMTTAWYVGFLSVLQQSLKERKHESA